MALRQAQHHVTHGSVCRCRCLPALHALRAAEHLVSAYFSHRAFFNLKLGPAATPAGGGTSSGDGAAAASSAAAASAAAKKSADGGQPDSAGGGGDQGDSSSSSGPLDNPDQRICDDVAHFVRSSVLISISLLSKVFNCIAFAGGWAPHTH